MAEPDGGRVLLAAASLVVGAALLGATLAVPPVGTCDPPIGAAHALFALAQVLALAGVVLLRRMGAGDATTGLVVAAWSALACCALLMRSTAGDAAALGRDDLVHGIGGGLGLFLLLFGLGTKLREARGGGVAAGVGMVAVLALAAAWMADGVVRRRPLETWARLQAIDVALARVTASAGRPALEDVPVAQVLAALGSGAPADLETDDAWGHPILYEADADHYAITSWGLRGRPGPFSEGPSRDYADDLVLRDGAPWAWPEIPCTGKPRERPRPLDLRGR